MASVVMIMGYGIIAVPTGIVTVELARAGRAPTLEAACPACFRAGHDVDAQFCKHCGASLTPATPPDVLAPHSEPPGA
jgi:voltage-gated potassium channel